MEKIKGFTLVEILVVIAIIALLAVIILFSAIQYVNKGRDAAVKGNLVILVTAGELWYDKNNSTYTGFCSSNAKIRAFGETPTVDADEHCNERIIGNVGTAWAACSRLFVYPEKAYCVDNKGNQKEIDNSDCMDSITTCIIP